MTMFLIYQKAFQSSLEKHVYQSFIFVYVLKYPDGEQCRGKNGLFQLRTLGYTASVCGNKERDLKLIFSSQEQR